MLITATNEISNSKGFKFQKIQRFSNMIYLMYVYLENEKNWTFCAASIRGPSCTSATRPSITFFKSGVSLSLSAPPRMLLVVKATYMFATLKSAVVLFPGINSPSTDKAFSAFSTFCSCSAKTPYMASKNSVPFLSSSKNVRIYMRISEKTIEFYYVVKSSFIIWSDGLRSYHRWSHPIVKVDYQLLQ